jgi:hypothetical protein
MLLRMAERTAILLVSLAVSSLLVFGFMVLLPGDPARVALGVNATEADVARLRLEYGLERPLLEQYPRLDRRADPVRPRGCPTSAELRSPPDCRPTAGLAHPGCCFDAHRWSSLALPFGTFMAVHHRKASGLVLSADQSQIGVAVPAFLAGILLITVFAVQLGWLPAAGGRHRHTTRGCSSSNWCCRRSRWDSSRGRCSPATCARRCSTCCARTSCAPPAPRASPRCGLWCDTAAQCRRPGRHRPWPTAGDPAGRRGRHRAGLRHPRPRVAAAGRRRQP